MSARAIGKLANHVLLALLLLVALSLVIGIWLYAFDQNPAVVINNLPLPTDKTVYKAGGAIVVTTDYCRYTNSSLVRQVQFEGEIVFRLPVEIISGRPTGCQVINVSVATVPDYMPPGRYRLVGRNEYRVNFIATRYTEWFTTEFEVLP